MSRGRIPKIDSIEEPARSWDTHDIADLEDEFEEVGESVFDWGGDA